MGAIPDIRGLPRIAFAEYLHWTRGRAVKSHAHDDLWQLDCFPSGSGTYVIGGRRHRIAAEYAYVVPPGVSHEIAGDRNDPPVNMTVKFTPEHPPAAGRAVALEPGEAADVAELMRKVVAETVLASEEHALVAAMRLTELLLLLDRASAAQRGEPPTPRPVARAERYLVDHAAERVRLEDVARHAGVRPEHLCRAFKRATGTTPFERLRLIRVQRAKRELARCDAPLAEVAAAAGFGSARDMGRAFKRVEGTPPRAFRRAAASRDG